MHTGEKIKALFGRFKGQLPSQEETGFVSVPFREEYAFLWIFKRTRVSWLWIMELDDLWHVVVAPALPLQPVFMGAVISVDYSKIDGRGQKAWDSAYQRYRLYERLEDEVIKAYARSIDLAYDEHMRVEREVSA
ncbi:hypothetical protein CO174_04840 [Candidatus Uhrbacteria bacterium CG_4_9_14_3_um_filter_50_9]|uniref:Uncharacterized protein n=1 Tax=Candidatus Uhrbacteria bacterium CG_4_9_14_3_um_filter_50_9 TaxID=1975035 RepID=A0A2M7XB77_9BACT|nr:MAG: hypothetical protein CO174_04840 [Candidatus Uhrbacteria bacterium CG_4_9_14_3_um_filter_50_9]